MRCMKLSPGDRSGLGNETIRAAGLPSCRRSGRSLSPTSLGQRTRLVQGFTDDTHFMNS